MRNRNLTWWFGLLVLLKLIGGTGVVSGNPASSHAQAPSPLLNVLSDFRRDGASLLCGPSRVESAFGVRVHALGVARYENGIVEEKAELLPNSAVDGVKGGTYRRFRSEVTSFCEVSVSISPGALCGILSSAYKDRVGELPMPYLPPHPLPARATLLHHNFRVADQPTPNEVWFTMSNGQACASQVLLRARGAWSVAGQ